jgi:hypothetical protein
LLGHHEGLLHVSRVLRRFGLGRDPVDRRLRGPRMRARALPFVAAKPHDLSRLRRSRSSAPSERGIRSPIRHRSGHRSALLAPVGRRHRT